MHDAYQSIDQLITKLFNYPSVCVIVCTPDMSSNPLKFIVLLVLLFV